MNKLILSCLWLVVYLSLTGCNGTNPVPTPTPTPVPEPLPPTPVVMKFETGLIKPPHRDFGVLHFSPKRDESRIPENFDWVEQGFGTPIRDQGQCGSCWAFGGTQSIEMGYKIFAHKDVDFSEQQLVGNLFDGCGGGYFVYDFQMQNGQTDEKSCPYTATNRRCSKTLPTAGKAINGGLVGAPGRRPTVGEMQAAIQAYGAVAVTVGADDSFMNVPHSGVAPCGGQTQTNHIVALAGWKTVNGQVYFHLKNSWGTSWGEGGYSWVKLGCWNLGEEASWVAVDAVPCKPPVVKLPAEYVLYHGDTVLLAVKAVQGVTYEWSEKGHVLGTASELEYTADDTAVLTLKTHNQCGDGEIKTQVTVTN